MSKPLQPLASHIAKSAPTKPPQYKFKPTTTSLPASYYRGGTSRAIFFNRAHLPENKREWDSIFRGALGSPDPWGRQLDGMGGGISSLSKICVVGEPTREDADVDYTFVAVGVDSLAVDYSSNCGNMISAVGPYALHTRLVTKNRQARMGAVRIHNTNTGKIIRASFPIRWGMPEEEGMFAIDGVAGRAAGIQLDFLDPAGSRTGKMLPTGNVVDEIEGVSATCIDVANPCVFVRAGDLGIKGDLAPEEIGEMPELLKRLDLIRRQAGVKMGLAKTAEKVPPSVPKIGIVSAPLTPWTKVDFLVRAMSVGQPHKAVPITVALALGAAAKVEGSTVQSVMTKKPVEAHGTTIGHASGKIVVGASWNERQELEHASVFRTARRLFEGRVFWK